MNEREAVFAIAEAARSAGARALLVGGCVRDELLGLSPKDFDLEVFGIAPDRLVALLSGRFEIDLVGLSFGVVKLRHLCVDVAVPRRETKLGLGHRAFDAHWDPSLSVAEAAAQSATMAIKNVLCIIYLLSAPFNLQ